MFDRLLARKKHKLDWNFKAKQWTYESPNVAPEGKCLIVPDPKQFLTPSGESGQSIKIAKQGHCETDHTKVLNYYSDD